MKAVVAAATEAQSPAFLLQKYNHRASKNVYFGYINNFTQYKWQNDICRYMFIMNI